MAKHYYSGPQRHRTMRTRGSVGEAAWLAQGERNRAEVQRQLDDMAKAVAVQAIYAATDAAQRGLVFGLWLRTDDGKAANAAIYQGTLA